MYVVKIDGHQETIHFDKITTRLTKLSYVLSVEHHDPVIVEQKVYVGVYKGVTTSQLDELVAEIVVAMTANHPDYASLAVRIVVSNLHKNTKKSFSETIKDMYKHVNDGSGLKAPLIDDDVCEIIIKVGKNVTRCLEESMTKIGLDMKVATLDADSLGRWKEHLLGFVKEAYNIAFSCRGVHRKPKVTLNTTKMEFATTALNISTGDTEMDRHVSKLGHLTG